jgi:hypothetical protein
MRIMPVRGQPHVSRGTCFRKHPFPPAGHPNPTGHFGTEMDVSLQPTRCFPLGRGSE